MKRIIYFILPLALIFGAPGALAGKVFKWIDDEGIPQYTDQAPKDREYTIVETFGAPKSAEAALKKRAEAAAAAQASKSAAEESGKDFEAQKLERERQAKVRAENCKNARANLKTIQENARVRILGEDGEYRYLTPEERQAQIDQASEMIANSCEASQS